MRSQNCVFLRQVTPRNPWASFRGALLSLRQGEILVARQFADALQTSIKNQPVERSILEAIGRSVPVQTKDKESPSRADVSNDFVLSERRPIDLHELPRRVQLEIEDILREAADSSVNHRLPTTLAAIEAEFRSARHSGNHWEEPLIRWLRLSGDAAMQAGNFLSASEYYLATTRVGYRASSRVTQGIEPARLAAVNFARARLLRLMVGSGQSCAMAPRKVASPQTHGLYSPEISYCTVELAIW